MKFILKHINELRELCKNYNVADMYAFGSVTSDKFTSESDIDLLVRFENVEPLEYFDNYMGLKEELEELFLRNVDLVEVQTLKNPILIRSIERDKILLYGREGTKVAV